MIRCRSFAQFRAHRVAAGRFGFSNVLLVKARIFATPFVSGKEVHDLFPLQVTALLKDLSSGLSCRQHSSEAVMKDLKALAMFRLPKKLQETPLSYATPIFGHYDGRI